MLLTVDSKHNLDYYFGCCLFVHIRKYYSNHITVGKTNNTCTRSIHAGKINLSLCLTN
jgi:hypothetical protein